MCSRARELLPIAAEGSITRLVPDENGYGSTEREGSAQAWNAGTPKGGAQHDGSTASAGGVQQSAEQSGAGWSRSEEIDSSDKRYKSAQSGTSDTERGSGRRRQRRTPNAEADGHGNMVGAEAAPTMRVTPRIDGGPAAGRTGTAGNGDTRRS